MVIVSFILAGALLAILQTTLCMPSPVWLFAPDFYFILVGYLAYRLDLVRSLIILFPLGCILDVLSGTVLGMYSILCFSSYFLLRFVSSKIPLNESLYQIPLVGLTYLLVSWCMHFLLHFFLGEEFLGWIWWKMLVRAFLVALFTYPLFRLFDGIKKYAQRSLFLNRMRLRSDNRRRQQG